MKNSKKTLRQFVTLEGCIKLAFTCSLTIFAIIVSFIIDNPIIASFPMIWSTAGDICLMKKRNCFYNKSVVDFACGVMCFIIAHIQYSTQMHTKVQDVIQLIMITVAVIYIITVILLNKNKATIIVLLYAIVLISSVVNTFFFNKVAFIGGLLFFISDSLIGIFMLARKDNNWIQLAIWATYVPAQVLMITSLML